MSMLVPVSPEQLLNQPYGSSNAPGSVPNKNGSAQGAQKEVDQNFSYDNIFNFNTSKINVPVSTANSMRLLEEIKVIINSHINQIKSNNTNKRAWIILGHCFFTIKNYLYACACYTQAKNIDAIPNDPFLMVCLGAVYLHFGHYEAGIEHITNNYGKLPEYLQRDSKFRLAIALRRNGKYQEALRYFEILRGNPPKFATKQDIELQIAFTYQCYQNYDEAYKIYSEFNEQYPSNEKILELYLYMAYIRDETHILKTDLITALKKYPENPVFCLLKGRGYLKEHDYSNALAFYKKALRFHSNFSNFWCEIASVTYFLKDFKTTIDYLQRAVFLDKLNQNAWLNSIYMTVRTELTGFDLHTMCKRALEYNHEETFKNQISAFENVPATLHWFPVDIQQQYSHRANDYARAYSDAPIILPEICFRSSMTFGELIDYPKTLFPDPPVLRHGNPILPMLTKRSESKSGKKSYKELEMMVPNGTLLPSFPSPVAPIPTFPTLPFSIYSSNAIIPPILIDSTPHLPPVLQPVKPPIPPGIPSSFAGSHNDKRRKKRSKKSADAKDIPPTPTPPPPPPPPPMKPQQSIAQPPIIIQRQQPMVVNQVAWSDQLAMAPQQPPIRILPHSESPADLSPKEAAILKQDKGGEGS